MCGEYEKSFDMFLNRLHRQTYQELQYFPRSIQEFFIQKRIIVNNGIFFADNTFLKNIQAALHRLNYFLIKFLFAFQLFRVIPPHKTVNDLKEFGRFVTIP